MVGDLGQQQYQVFLFNPFWERLAQLTNIFWKGFKPPTSKGRYCFFFVFFGGWFVGFAIFGGFLFFLVCCVG